MAAFLHRTFQEVLKIGNISSPTFVAPPVTRFQKLKFRMVRVYNALPFLPYKWNENLSKLEVLDEAYVSRAPIHISFYLIYSFFTSLTFFVAEQEDGFGSVTQSKLLAFIAFISVFLGIYETHMNREFCHELVNFVNEILHLNKVQIMTSRRKNMDQSIRMNWSVRQIGILTFLPLHSLPIPEFIAICAGVLPKSGFNPFAYFHHSHSAWISELGFRGKVGLFLIPTIVAWLAVGMDLILARNSVSGGDSLLICTYGVEPQLKSFPKLGNNSSRRFGGATRNWTEDLSYLSKNSNFG